MNSLRQDVNAYRATRRAMGFKVEGQDKLLRRFVSYCEARDVARVTTDIALEWANTQVKTPVTDALFARRLDAVRVFARYQHALDPDAEVPPEQHRPRRYQSKEPNVFSDKEVRALMAATTILTPRFKALMWHTLLGLLATTGMRPGEACRLNLDDIDLDNGVIQVLHTKFGKSRLVFIHPTTAAAIGDYLQVRRDWVGSSATACPALFVNARRGPLDPGRLGKTFHQVVTAAGVSTQPGRRPPRLHDLRHTYTVATLLGWYRDGHDVQERLPLLSTWLGHVDPASTYWYLHAVPELLAHAADRLEAQSGRVGTEPLR